ncbi:MAG TPA: hypothetical protein VFQ63_02630, partial [Patescibacteria group bacterium]|nr:hypothetical protein [Patescibacteria group bacterium]
NSHGLVWIKDSKGKHPPFVKIVPLLEIIAEAIGSPVASPKVKVIFENLVSQVGSELHILLKASLEDIQKTAGEKVAEGVKKVREAHIVIKPGYDGVYGVVKIWEEKKDPAKNADQPVGSSSGEQIGIDF